jgi:hypothetical protein
VEARGVVTRLVKNPHSFLYFTATDEKGQKVEWQIEMGTGARLARSSLTVNSLSRARRSSYGSAVTRGRIARHVLHHEPDQGRRADIKAACRRNPSRREIRELR